MPRALLEAIERYQKSLQSVASTLGLLSEAFERGLGALTAAGIGIGIEPSMNGQGLLINAVAPAMPAHNSGIAVGDHVQAINGALVSEMTVDDAVDRLRGVAGSQVTLVVLQGTESRTVVLTRAPLMRVDPGRLATLPQAMTGLRDLSLSLQRELDVESKDVRALASSPNPEAAFGQLSSMRKGRLATIDAKSAEIVGLAHKSLQGNPEALDLFVRFADLMPAMSRTPNDSQTYALAMDLDRKMDRFKEISGAGSLDAELMELNGNLIGALSKLQMDLMGQARLIGQGFRMAKNAPDREQIRETARSLSQRLDRWRARLVKDRARIEALDEGQDFYANYVKLLNRLDLPKEALVASEAARARAFLDLLAARQTVDTPRTDGTSSLPAGEVAPSAPDLDEILAMVQEVRGTVMEYFVMDDAVLAWVVSPALEGSAEHPTVKMRRLFVDEVDKKDVRRQDLHDAIARLTEPLGSRNAREQPADTVRISTALRRLYTLLIAQVADLLPNQPDWPLIIVPHQELFAVPFAALARPDASGGDRYLVQDHSLVYVPSLGVLSQIQSRAQARSRDAKPSLLAVVNPKFGPELVDQSGELPAPLPDLEMAVKNHRLVSYFNSLI
jgi:hypothetical protein